MSNNLDKKKYKVLSSAEKKEIQRRFESGENLLDLSIEYKIPYGSLKNMSSKNGWVKGKKSEILMLTEYVNESLEFIKKKEEILETHREAHENLMDTINTIDPTNINVGIALSNRAKALKDSYSVAKELYDIRTPKEELELRTQALKYQQLIEEIEKHKPKVIDLDDTEEAELV